MRNMLMKVPALAALVLFASAGAIRGESGGAKTATADLVIEREMRRYGIVGLTVGVRVDNRIVLEKAYGLANVELAVPARRDTVYQLSSTTKTITGTALMKVLGEKNISLDTPARTLLPELPEAWGAIAVRQLASHLSGLPDVVEIEAKSAEEAIEVLGRKPLIAEPGAEWRYNQTNYLLVRRIIERLSGSSFEQYVARTLFAPAGMTSTTFAGSVFDVVPNRATSYQGVNEVLRLREYRFPQFNNGAAGLNSNVPDLLRFDAALRSGAILRLDALATLWQPARLADGREVHYGIGWDLDRTAGHRSAGHEGGGATTIRRFIDDDATVVLLTNGARQRWDVEDLAQRIVAVWKPEIRAPQARLADGLLALIEAGRISAARDEHLAFLADPSNASLPTEAALNALGYQLLRRRMLDEAVTVFRWNTLSHAESANAHDSLGEALLAQGDREGARAAYERALELDPAMESARKALSGLRGSSALLTNTPPAA
jgi:CubicO group peptidase (beta-lactamase class C family)